MGRFDQKYSNEQREAIVEAMVDRGMSAAKACKAAKAGELGLPPFDFAEGTAGHYGAKEKRRRRGQEQDAKTRSMDPEKRLDALAVRQLAILEHEVARIEKASGKAELTVENVEKLRKIGAVARELRSLLRGMAPTRGSKAERAKQAEAAKPSSVDDRAQAVLDELQGALEAKRATEDLQEKDRDTGAGALAHAAPRSTLEPVPA